MKSNPAQNQISKRLAAGFAAACALFGMTELSQAQIIYSNDLNSDNGSTWAILNGSETPPVTNRANFQFDYSKIGIPVAPHTTDGTTIGLQLLADINYPEEVLGSVTGAGLSVSPLGFSITANFDMHVDMWVNYNAGGPFSTPTPATTAIDGSGSSIFYGCGYGTAATAAQVAGTADSVYVGTCTDNGSSAQMRMYGPNQTASYQSGAYQGSGTGTPAFPGDAFVYNNSTGTRTFYNTAPWNTIFPSQLAPAAETNLYPEQEFAESLPGLIAFKWHDVEIQKIGNVIVYSIDSNIVATANSASAGSTAGGYLTFLAFDINGNSSADLNFTNLNYVLFDNIRVYNYANIVNVQATTPNASEVGPTPGVFTLSRTSAGVPITVNYTLTGTATNGIQYVSIPTNVTFSATATSTNVIITPIDTGTPTLPTTVVLTVQPGTGYTGAGSDIVTIANGDTPTIDITASQPTMYERYANNPSGYGDFITYFLTRRGRTTAESDVTVNITSPNAVAGTDYQPVGTIVMAAGVTTNSFQILPIRNPAVTGNKTLTVTVASVSGGGAVGNATANTATIVDSDYPPASQILNDPLTDGSPAETNKWAVTYGTGDLVNHSTDFEVDFGYPPVSTPPGGGSGVLHMTCNKNSGAGANAGAPGGLNVYYTNQALSGNYAVRFSMNLVEGQASLNTWEHEGALFGINHAGTQSNWWYAGGTDTAGTYGSDGVWYYVGDQYGGTLQGEYEEFVGAGATGWTREGALVAPNLTSVFKSNPGPYTSLDDTFHQTGGVAAEASPNLGYDASTWTDVEIKQINNVVTMSLNRTPMFTYTNTSTYTSGYLMLGYSDPYGDVETSDSSVYYANLTVVQLVTPVITKIASAGGNITITFTGGTGDAATSFTLQSSANVAGPYVDVASTITPVGGVTFQAVVPQSGTMQFYRIRRN